MPKNNHILIIDDDKRIRNLLSQYLQKNNFYTSSAADCQEANKLLTYFIFDLIILDVMLPNESGIDFAKKLRVQNYSTPILMLSALGSTEDRIIGLESGVDDYLPKPFEPKELLLRASSIIKRSPKKDLSIISFNDYIFDLDRVILKNKNGLVSLTTRELSILKELALQKNQVISRDELAKLSDDINSRSIDVQITRIRNKIETDPKNPKILITVRGEGYMLLADD